MPDQRTHSSLSHEEIKLADRREFDRHPPEIEPTYVWVSLDTCVKGQLIDESDGGIGVEIDQADLFEIGFEVRVSYGEVRRTATIIDLVPCGDHYHLCLEWR